MTTKSSKNLDIFENPNPEKDYLISIEIPEFTCLCPKTGQPDFANIYFIANEALNTSWLLKYFKSYKERGDFHEHCVESMLQDIQKESNCSSIEISGRFMRRGGIDINPTRSSSKRLFFKNFRFFNQ